MNVWCVYIVCSEDQAEKHPEVQVLARDFKRVAGELISLLEQVPILVLYFFSVIDADSDMLHSS